MTDLLEQYEISTNYHRKLQNAHNDLLVRTISVTDDVLREQLRDEYLIATEELAISEVGLEVLDKEVKNQVLNECVIDFKDFYINQFKIVKLNEAVDLLNGISMKTLAEKNRLRLPTDLKQQRELSIFANTLNYRFVILDYEGFIIDTIGKGNISLYIYSMCFLRFNEEQSNIVGIPKAILV